MSKYKESTGDGKKTLSATDFDGAFPQKGDAIDHNFSTYGSDRTDRWGFAKDQTDLGSVCKSGEDTCPASPTTPAQSFKGLWTWTHSDSSDKTVDKWSKNITATLKGIYGLGDSVLGLSFDSFKGSWSKSSGSQA